ncbi:MAG: hypothetical protein WKG06_08845 [Segetibacter sp.]
MNSADIETFCPASRQEWRLWLKENHSSKQSVWLVLYKKESNKPTISWSEAVDEALCFGWIDSKRKPVNEDKFIQFFSKRKLNGTWSKVNKEKIKQLIDEGLMTKVGFDSIETAKQNGSSEDFRRSRGIKNTRRPGKELKIKANAMDFF